MNCIPFLKITLDDTALKRNKKTQEKSFESYFANIFKRKGFKKAFRGTRRFEWLDYLKIFKVEWTERFKIQYIFKNSLGVKEEKSDLSYI